MFESKTILHKNSSLNQIVIQNKTLNFEAVIYPNLGASLQKLNKNGIEIIDGILNHENGIETYKSKFNSSLLFPFPNRVSEGSYTFNNQNYALICNETGLNNALHGHIYNKPFLTTKTSITKNKATLTLVYCDNGLTKGFPFSYQIEITYIFTNNKLTLNFKVTNSGKKPFPFGIGWHPYFKSDNLTTSILSFEGTKKYHLNKKMIPQQEIQIPFKTPLELQDTFLDDCFIINKPKAVFKTDNYKIDIDFTSKTEKCYLQVYTPSTRNCIAIEPMTCAPNCFNNTNGLQILQPNKEFNWQINLRFTT